MKKDMKKFLKENLSTIVLLAVFFCFYQSGLASTGDMPFEGPLEKIMKSITGPVAKSMAIIAVAGCGIAMAFGEMGGVMKRMVNIVFGISIVFAAVVWVPKFFGFSGGVLF